MVFIATTHEYEVGLDKTLIRERRIKEGYSIIHFNKKAEIIEAEIS